MHDYWAAQRSVAAVAALLSMEHNAAKRSALKVLLVEEQRKLAALS